VDEKKEDSSSSGEVRRRGMVKKRGEKRGSASAVQTVALDQGGMERMRLWLEARGPRAHKKKQKEGVKE